VDDYKGFLSEKAIPDPNPMLPGNSYQANLTNILARYIGTVVTRGCPGAQAGTAVPLHRQTGPIAQRGAAAELEFDGMAYGCEARVWYIERFGHINVQWQADTLKAEVDCEKS